MVKVSPSGGLFYGVADVAKIVGVKYDTFLRLIRNELVPKPTHKIGTYKFLRYSKKEAEEMYATFSDYWDHQAKVDAEKKAK